MQTIKPEYLLNKVANLIIKRDKSIRVNENIENQNLIEDIINVNNFQGNDYVIIIKKQKKWLRNNKE